MNINLSEVRKVGPKKKTFNRDWVNFLKVSPSIFWCSPCLLTLSELLVPTRSRCYWEISSFSFFQVWRTLCEGCFSCRLEEIRLFCIWYTGTARLGYPWCWNRRIGNGPIWSIIHTWSTLSHRRFRRNRFVYSKCKKSPFRIEVCIDRKVFLDILRAASPYLIGCSFYKVYWRTRIEFWRAGVSLHFDY